MRYGVGGAGSPIVNPYYLIVQWDAISGCRFRLTQIEDLNRRDPVPGSGTGDPGGKFFMNTVCPPAICARQVTQIIDVKGPIRQYDG